MNRGIFSRAFALPRTLPAPFPTPVAGIVAILAPGRRGHDSGTGYAHVDGLTWGIA